MVKKIDDIHPDHIGWRLWDAAAVWKEKFAQQMIDMGHDWYAEARSSVVPYVGLNGTRQAEIVTRMGLSKQAVQQLIADLERSDILRRDPDPEDGRGKIVRFTDAGLRAQRDSATAKQHVEDEMKALLGAENFDQLMVLLKKIGSKP
ncbi:MarR family winged helix-turn-helix transcriptional regulator [Aliiroseovarius crassostreae]|uniref:MarR family winged helix-turn-helix transcriptional regulator n=1 Tax=Aliiroseovarius crassostreae TaxID=154981 RepID=UPI003C7D5047